MDLVYKGDTKIKMEEHKKIIDIFKNEIENSKTEIIACKCYNEIRSLSYEPAENETVELIDVSSADGMRIYVRGLLLIMSKAFHKLYPEALLTVNYQLSNMSSNIKEMNSYICDLEHRIMFLEDYIHHATFLKPYLS